MSGREVTASTRRVTLSFDLPTEVLGQYDDLNRAAGITVESVAASLCYEHDPVNGFIHFTVSDSGSSQIPDPPSGATGVGSEDPPPLTHPVAATKEGER